MKLKKIENAVVHCKTKEEAEQLVNCFYPNKDLISKRCWINCWSKDEEESCYRIACGYLDSYNSIRYFERELYEITEFTDLIEPELTAEEAIEWLFKHYDDGEYINVFRHDYSYAELFEEFTPSEIAEGIAKWKADHEKQEPEKKDPEVECLNVCRIMEIDEFGYEKCVHEEHINLYKPNGAQMTNILKRYMATHEGNFMAVQEFVCRAKKG